MQEVTGARIREIILRQSFRARVGHIGSSLSIADIVATLFDQVMQIQSPENPERDRFILSKGHAVLALYASLYLKGWLPKADLDTFCGEGSELGMHPESKVRGIDFCSGSLGQGLCLAGGAALAAKMQGSQRQVYALLSDAEMNEGSVWEAALFAGHHKLGNLAVVVDVNGQQALGMTADVLSTEPLLDKWKAFGWDAYEVDGHCVQDLARYLVKSARQGSRPTIILARTVFGKGVDFMEGQIKWHYWPMNEAEFSSALGQVCR